MSVKMKDLSDEIARHHFSYGLQPGVFADKISRKKPKTMEEMRERAPKFIQMEDMQEFRVKKREKEDAAVPKTAPRPNKPSTRPSERKAPRFTTYTPLAVPRARILQEAFSADSLPAARKKPPPPNADGSKHCQYHRAIGHTTEECHTLRDKIEEFIR